MDERGTTCISNQINDNSQSNDYDASYEPTATVPFDPNDPDAVLEVIEIFFSNYRRVLTYLFRISRRKENVFNVKLSNVYKSI